MHDPVWSSFDHFVGERVLGDDPVLATVLSANWAAGLRSIDVSAPQARFLELLVRLTGASRVLEVGTLGGYSAIAMCRGLPPNGRLVTLELDAHHLAIARNNIEQAGYSGLVETRLGPAADSLRRMREERVAPFDLIFIDADKPGYPGYLEGAIELSRPGTTIVLDNVVRGGRVADTPSPDENAAGARLALEMLGRHPRLRATVLQTVGDKGHDGFALAVVLP